MNIINLLLKPIMPLLENAVDVDIDEVGAARLVLHLLGSEENDEVTAKCIDDAIKGGTVIEAVDGAIGQAYLKKVRRWAEETVNPSP